MRYGQQQLDHLRLVCRRSVTAEQQFDVVVIGIVDTFDGLADEGLNVG